MVQKITGPIIIRISAMKPSPSGLSSRPKPSGVKPPTSTPAITATITEI
jgi:hypothetical protein